VYGTGIEIENIFTKDVLLEVSLSKWS